MGKLDYAHPIDFSSDLLSTLLSLLVILGTTIKPSRVLILVEMGLYTKQTFIGRKLIPTGGV